MSHTEHVRYALKETEFREVSDRKGVVDYHLLDEFGNRRKVSAMATVGWAGKLRGVRPIHHRELPLVQALAKASLNETIEVDFSEFNKKYARGSARSQKIKVKEIKVNSKDAQLITGMSSLVDHKERLLKLIAVSVIGFAAMLYLFSHFNS